MGRDPLVLTVDGWKLIISVKDQWTEVLIETDDKPTNMHFVRITPTQSGVLRDYLDDTLPAHV